MKKNADNEDKLILSIKELLYNSKKENSSFCHEKHHIKLKLLKKLCKDYLRAKKSKKQKFKNGTNLPDFLKLQIKSQSELLFVEQILVTNVFCNDNSSYIKKSIKELLDSIYSPPITKKIDASHFIERGKSYLNILKSFKNSGGLGYYDHVSNYKFNKLKTYNKALDYINELLKQNENIILIERDEKYIDDDYKFFISFISDSCVAISINDYIHSDKEKFKVQSLTMLPDPDNIITKDKLLNFNKENFRINSSTNKCNPLFKDHYLSVCKQPFVNPQYGFAQISTQGSNFKFLNTKLCHQSMILRKF
jgi:hypothetical protein